MVQPEATDSASATRKARREEFINCSDQESV
jgi:hypothetical protein